MRVLQVAPPWFTVPPTGYGGTEQVVALLTDGLVRRGHAVTLLAAGGSDTAATLWTTFEAPPTRQLGDPAIELTHVLSGYRERDAFDLIHDHTTTGAALGSMPGGPPVVHTLHGPWTSALSGFYAAVSPYIDLVAISHDQADRAPAGIRVAAVVHNGIDVDDHPFVATKGEHLAFLGRANLEKGPELAIEVARRLGRRLLMGVKVNEPGEHAYFAAHIAPALRHGDVELVPVRTHAEKCELLGTAAAVLFPVTWAEPFGLVPVEASACGTPVVAFAKGGLWETVEHGRNGFLVESGNLEAFCAAVEHTSELDPRTCRHVARERFDATRMVAGYEGVYRNLVEGGACTEREVSSPA
jgi:glycosyltransferase involved in cell wall biosynthesis